MKSIKNILDKKKLFQPKILEDKTVFYIFNKIIGEEFGNLGREKLKPDYYKNKTIYVKSASSNWSSELWLNRGKIIRKINKELGGKEIEEIKIK